MNLAGRCLTSLALAALAPAAAAQAPALDILLINGRVLDGAGNPWVRQDVGIRGDRIAYLGLAVVDKPVARETLDVSGLIVTPGFIDMHSHADLATDHGRPSLAFLYQGITTAVLGVDGSGESTLHATFDGYRRTGIGLNALHYVGHGAARRSAMGAAARAPNEQELEAMRRFVRRGMEQGAIGLSTGLFYSPGTYAASDEVIELNRVAAAFGGIYDTHDRDLGAAYPGVGFLESMKEAIMIGERAGTPVIFSHIGPQGRANYGRAADAAKLIAEARTRGVNVMAAQHPYAATQSNLRSYAIPDWAAAGGQQAMLARFADPELVRRLDRETMAMMAIRGGADKIRFVDRRRELNGKNLAQVADSLQLTVPAAVRKILEDGNASVMNMDLYDLANIRYLARFDWMMTCTDGRPAPPGVEITHPRSYGAFTRKLRMLALDDSVVTVPFVVRGMTSLAATFLGLRDRGLVRLGFVADLAVFDLPKVHDPATYDAPKQYAQGTVHVLLNGRFAIRDGKATGALAGEPLLRGGMVYRAAERAGARP
jgi:N-acyl-D-amino-acid deacylase